MGGGREIMRRGKPPGAKKGSGVGSQERSSSSVGGPKSIGVEGGFTKGRWPRLIHRGRWETREGLKESRVGVIG